MAQSFALGLIRLYQKTRSPRGMPVCRYVPTCSEYGYEAIARYGVVKGGWLTMKRIARCHPFHSQEFDPVP